MLLVFSETSYKKFFRVFRPKMTKKNLQLRWIDAEKFFLDFCSKTLTKVKLAGERKKIPIRKYLACWRTPRRQCSSINAVSLFLLVYFIMRLMLILRCAPAGCVFSNGDFFSFPRKFDLREGFGAKIHTKNFLHLST